MNTKNKTDKTAQGKPELPGEMLARTFAQDRNEPERESEFREKYFKNFDKPQAEHSPLPWHVNDMNAYEIRVGDGAKGRKIADCREANCICYTAQDTANAKLIVASVNHAGKLAEALRRFVEAYRMESEHDLECAEAIAREALANWEGAK